MDTFMPMLPLLITYEQLAQILEMLYVAKTVLGL